MTNIDEMQMRIEKSQRIKHMGIPIYPESYDKECKISTLLSRQNETFRSVEEVITDSKKEVSIAGRIVLFRSFWKIAFAHLQDDSGRIQIMFSRDNCHIHVGNERKAWLQEWTEELSAFKFIEKLVDLGDFIGIKGELFHTHKGELTVFASEFSFLGKALRPLPEKFHGINDDELKYRERYLDLISSPENMDRFIFRSRFIRTLREFYWKEWFHEIEWQVLTNAATGAAAKPYITHQDALDIDVFLRISHEIPLKLMNIAGMEKIFELWKAFRNEWQDPSHLPEHLHLEHNCSYWTYQDNMAFTEKMFDYLFDTLKLERKRKILNKQNELVDVDFTTPWERIDYIEMVKQDTGIDVSKYGNVEVLRKDIKDRGIEIEWMDSMGLTTLIDYLYKKMCRPKLIHPTFLYNYPIILKPFARRNDEHREHADAFQLVINGWELVNSDSELVDPIDQAHRFSEWEAAAKAWDEEAMTGDAEFVRAMEYGMPPISWWGMGVDRLIALLTTQNNLRDVILFPLMRPKNEIINH